MPDVRKHKSPARPPSANAPAKAVPAKSAAARAVRIGFVSLIDAAPLIVARELGYFREEGLDVTLSREIGWGNVRDKLAYGHLDASHALLGMPIQSHTGAVTVGQPITALMGLGSGGDAITLSQRLMFAGVNSASSLARWIRQSRGLDRPVFAHVFSCSMHHYLLRNWLAGGGTNPDEDVKLCVLPPTQMATQMSGGYLDGYCVGEPWNTMADQAGCGRIVALTTDILPAHPEKVLAVNQRWATREADLLVPLVRAVLRGSMACSDAEQLPQLAAMLAKPQYLNVAAETITASLQLDRSFGMKPGIVSVRPHDWKMRSFDATFPSVTHFAWMIAQMLRWQHVDPSIEPLAVARRCVDLRPYRQAAADLDIACPASDAPPMPLRNGRTFHADRVLESLIA